MQIIEGNSNRQILIKVDNLQHETGSFYLQNFQENTNVLDFENEKKK